MAQSSPKSADTMRSDPRHQGNVLRPRCKSVDPDGAPVDFNDIIGVNVDAVCKCVDSLTSDVACFALSSLLAL